jgi:uncharacterized membrane protein YeaQ/YmgE (transglycosylase-associated protein family)
MTGMEFIPFLILLVAALAVSGVLHYCCEYYVTPGPWSFAAKVVVAWIGAWLGSPVLGHWPHRLPFLHYQDVWIVPAILGATAAVILAVDLAKMAAPKTARRGRR